MYPFGIFSDLAYLLHQETEMLAIFTYADELAFEPGLNLPEHSALVGGSFLNKPFCLFQAKSFVIKTMNLYRIL